MVTRRVISNRFTPLLHIISDTTLLGGKYYRVNRRIITKGSIIRSLTKNDRCNRWPAVTAIVLGEGADYTSLGNNASVDTVVFTTKEGGVRDDVEQWGKTITDYSPGDQLIFDGMAMPSKMSWSPGE